MKGKLAKSLVLGLLGLLIAALPGLVGCGAEKAAGKEIVIGYIGDLTGPAQFGIRQVYDTIGAYFEMAQDEGLVPSGVSIKLVSYDTAGAAARVTPGYIWLQGKGAKLMIIPSPAEAAVVRSRFESDEVPTVGAPTSMRMLDCQWSYAFYGPPFGNIQVLMQWVSEQWQSEGRQGKPKVGLVSYSGIDFYEEMLDGAEAMVALYPGKFDWVSGEMSPKGTMAWSIEIGRLMRCDYIIMGLTGPPLASFIKEARQRGYGGKFIGPLESFGGYWSLLKNAVAAEHLNGIVIGLYSPWWNDDVPFINECKERVQRYLPSDQAQSQLMHANFINGSGVGILVVDALRRAIDEVGVENLDGATLRGALAATDMEVQGFGNRWKFAQNVNCLCQTVQLREYGAANDTWTAISDWYRPPCLGG